MFDEDGMDLLRATEGTTSFTVFSQAMGAGDKAVLFFQKDVIDPKDTNLSLLYPPALGTIPIGYWTSRALGPSSKARDGIGLYTLGDPYSRLNKKLHVKR